MRCFVFVQCVGLVISLSLSRARALFFVVISLRRACAFTPVAAKVRGSESVRSGGGSGVWWCCGLVVVWLWLIVV